ncbi:MAG: hypothetical protein DHS20C16_20830 [Phycisphaerae bacterium]|nr:MAG: hypothetical protein DHS20C16_20830 [Phycisphaerae bacterium]
MSTDLNEIIKMLQKSYSMELETVMNYIANSINPDGVRAEEIKKSLAADIQEEIQHAQELGKRIKQLGGRIPGAIEVELGGQKKPPIESTDVVSVIEAVIEAEQGACEQYNKIIRACDGSDFVTQDLCTRLLADEEEHLTLFRGFLKEYSNN